VARRRVGGGGDVGRCRAAGELCGRWLLARAPELGGGGDGVGRQGLAVDGRKRMDHVPQTGGPGGGVGRRRARPFRVRADASEAQIWAGNGSAGGRKADARPFGSARWADFCVRFDPNGHVRTKWVGALELLLKYFHLFISHVIGM
jgi:hypothetical protein